MKQVFITTPSHQAMERVCKEISDPSGLVGPTIVKVTGRAGLGKTESSKKIAVDHDAIYVRTLNIMSPLMVLREIAWELSAIRPRTTGGCLDLITDEMGRRPRAVLVDEADLLPMKCLEMLRGMNERCGCPIVLIGEEDLTQKIASRRRIVSRIRASVHFHPITGTEIQSFYKQALDIEIPPDAASHLAAVCCGDWRPLVTATVRIDRAMRASGVKVLDLATVKGLLGANGNGGADTGGGPK